MRSLLALAAVPLLAAAQDRAPADTTAATGAAAAPEASAAGQSDAPPVRRGIYAALGVGYSRVYDASYDDGGLVTRLSLGTTLSPRLLVGIEAGFSDYASDEQLTSFDVGVTFFPAARGLFLRGAFGYSGWEDLAQGYRGPTRRGANALGGLGYRLGAPGGISATLNVEGQFHLLPYGGVDQSKGDLTAKLTWGAWLGLQWQ